MKDNTRILKITKGKKALRHRNMVNSLFEDNRHITLVTEYNNKFKGALHFFISLLFYLS